MITNQFILPIAHELAVDLFAGELLPAVALPTVGFVAKACGEWHRYCKSWSGFNAVLPVSWEASYMGRA